MDKFSNSIEPAHKKFIKNINLVQTSCGWGDPLFDYTGERAVHFDWAEKKGADGLSQYIQNNNIKSLDDLPTNLGLKFS